MTLRLSVTGRGTGKTTNMLVWLKLGAELNRVRPAVNDDGHGQMVTEPSGVWSRALIVYGNDELGRIKKVLLDEMVLDHNWPQT